jgi:hypothetical protein
MRSMHRVVALLALAALTACVSFRLPQVMGQPGYTQEELRTELADFSITVNVTVTNAADTIIAQTTNRQVRKRALLWKINLIPVVQEAAFEEDPREAYVSVLTLIVLMRQYLEKGPGGISLAEGQPIALQAAQELEAQLVAIGVKFLGKERAEQVHRDVEAHAARHPIAGHEFAMQAVVRTVSEVEQTTVFKQVASVPLSPFRALEGVGDSAAAIREFNDTAREFVLTIERLPEQVRWQVELLLYEIEDRETTVATLAAVEQVAASSARLSQAAERLPEDMRTLLEGSGGTLQQVSEIVERARLLAAPVRETAGDLELASAAWASVLAPEPGAPPEEPSRPFDIREWEQAVRELGTTAVKLEDLVQSLRAVSDARVVDAALAPVSATVDRADAAARGWVDLAAWRVLQLLLAAFALTLVYRVVSAALTRWSGTQRGLTATKQQRLE